MKLLGNMECPPSLLMTLTVVLSILLSVEAYPQEVFLYENYDDRGDYHVYRSHVPDSTFLDSRVNRMCAHGVWMFYKQVNYEEVDTWLYSTAGQVVCTNVTSSFASFRYLGANDTEVSTATFFDGKSYDGPQSTVTSLAHGNMVAKSYAITGSSPWTLYEGSNFGGQYKCITPTAPSMIVKDSLPSGWSNIGSVAKGCEARHGVSNHFRV